MDDTKGLAQAMNDSFLRDQNSQLKDRVERLESAVMLLTSLYHDPDPGYALTASGKRLVQLKALFPLKCTS
jgi:hypothetical protein